jgi:hypothetical protein
LVHYPQFVIPLRMKSFGCEMWYDHVDLGTLSTVLDPAKRGLRSASRFDRVDLGTLSTVSLSH